MAVPEQTPYIEHIGNGATTSFALKFQCESKDHLIVLIDDIEPPIATWSLTGGNVVFTTAPALGKKIVLQRNTPFSRTTDYQSYNNSFRPPAVNKDFDWIWLKLQELGVADWILGARIDALKNYVDRKDDELKAYLMEEIRKQGVALDQLDEYYNYLMQRLAQIAVDKGWDASFVVDASGKTQQEINDVIKNQKYLDVRLLGIFPHPELDQTLLINQADSFAKQHNIGLYFPSGVYRGFGLLPTTSWVGAGSSETIIKSSNETINSTEGFCRLLNSTKPILFEDINFDSNVNPDPLDWQGVFHSHFIGGAAFTVGNSQNVTFNRVKFSNSKFSCLRVAASSNIVISNCVTQRARGHSGDGVYFNNCNYVLIQNLTVRDVTRIGVVFENNTKNCTVSNSTVTYAHHASVDLGGGEYNAGFWAENSSHIYYDNCVADDVNKIGFVNTNGSGLLDVVRSKFTLNNCRVIGEVEYGFWCHTKADSVPADHLLVNCETTLACQAISPILNHATDRVIIRDSNFAIGGTKLGRVGLLLNGSTMRSNNQLPSLHLENVTVTHVDFDLTRYEDETSNVADLTFFDGMNIHTTLKNVRNTNSDISLYIKSREATAQSNINATLHVIDSSVRFPIFMVAGGVIVDGGSVSGSLNTISDIKVQNTTNSQRSMLTAKYVEVSDSVFDFNEQTEYLRLGTALSGREVRYKVINCKFYKDVSALDYSLRIQFEGTIKPTVIISNCDFYSKSTTPASDALAHIWAVREGTDVVFSGSFYDSHAIPLRTQNTIKPTPIEGLKSLSLH